MTKAFLEANGRAFTLAPSDLQAPNARLTRDVTTRHNGMRSLTWQQQKDGLDIYGAIFMLNLTDDNRIINVSSRALHMPCVRFHDTVTVSEKEAVEIAEDSLPTDRTDGTDEEAFSFQFSSLSPPSLLWYPLDQISAVKAWDVTLTVKPASLLPLTPSPSTHRLLIRADTGEVVEDINLTWSLQNATFSVYTDDSPNPMTPGTGAPTNYVPPEVPRLPVTLSALDTNASPEGWIPDGETDLAGNNANVYADWDDNDSRDEPPVSGTGYRVFDWPCDLTKSPTNYVNASQVQAFYLANTFHDRLYAMGFDEAAGNFQGNNFGRGGLGSDALVVEIQNGGLLGYEWGNQAWYEGWGDGTAGKVVMSIFGRSSPHRCAVLDAQLMYHEIAHGLSSRLIGNGFGLTTVQSRGMAEGWSDFFALTLPSAPGDDLHGCYAIATYAAIYQDDAGANYYGIRRFPYSTQTNKAPQTLADTDPNQIAFPPGIPRNPDFGSEDADQIHNIGEIWCLMLWECRANLIEAHGFDGNETMMQLVVDGMKLSPLNPTFIEARDAVLQADLVNDGGANQIALWKGFAKRGLGWSASVPPSVSTVGMVEGYDLPFGLTAEVTESSGDGDGYIEPGESGELVIALTSHEMALSNITAVLTTPSSNITVTVSNAALPAMAIGGTSTSSPPFVFTADGGFPGNADACFTVRVQSDKGWFDEPVTVRIGNPCDYPPEITDITVTDIGESEAWVSWRTGIPSRGRVEYGVATNYGSCTATGLTWETEHAAQLTGLNKGNVYH
ncbi:MAG: M36 family metallopeptidase [Lentisphaerae bacterium]|nr:M36 family metallopeptidase [Lentisphaerota bacterium]